jgi:hypothetical protein
LLSPVNPDDVLFLLQDVIDWELGAELPRFVWSHHHDPLGEPPPHPVTLVSDPAPIIGPWEGSLGWGPNPFFPRPPRPPNEIPFEGIDQINVGSVVRKWIEFPRGISVDVERLYDTSIEDLLILCVVGRPDDEILDTWKFKLGTLGDEDEWEVRLHGLMEQASRWLALGLAADDREWVRVSFEFGGMASGIVQVAAEQITQGVYGISIDHGWEGRPLPSVLGAATTDNLVEDIVGSIGSDPGIGNWWDGPSSAPFVTAGGNIPEEQLAAIEAAFKEEEEEEEGPYDGNISMRPIPKPTSLIDRLKEYLGWGGEQ